MPDRVRSGIGSKLAGFSRDSDFTDDQNATLFYLDENDVDVGRAMMEIVSKIELFVVAV